MSAFVNKLVDTVGESPIVNRSIYDITTLIMASVVVECVNWPVVSARSSSRLLSYAMDTENEPTFTSKGVARVVHDCKNVQVPQPLLFEVPLLPSTPF